jgi:hypothetical protein
MLQIMYVKHVHLRVFNVQQQQLHVIIFYFSLINFNFNNIKGTACSTSTFIYLHSG